MMTIRYLWVLCFGLIGLMACNDAEMDIRTCEDASNTFNAAWNRFLDDSLSLETCQPVNAALVELTDLCSNDEILLYLDVSLNEFQMHAADIIACTNIQTGSEECDNAIAVYLDALRHFTHQPESAWCERYQDALLQVLDVCNIESIITGLNVSQEEWNQLVQEIQNYNCS